jgi:hypothetical protein
MISTFTFAHACARLRAAQRILFFVVTFCVFAAQSDAATFYVNRTDDRNSSIAGCPAEPPATDCAIREAITAANSNAGPDTIEIANGITITLTLGALQLGGSTLLVQGNNAIIQRSSAPGTPAFRIMEVFTTNVGMNNLTIANGSATASPSVIDAGGILVGQNVTLALTGCDVVNNVASRSGAGIYNQGTLKLYGSNVTGNRGLAPDSKGGGIYVDVGATLETYDGSTISSNKALLSGAGIYSDGGTLKLNDTTIDGNSGPVFAGNVSGTVAGAGLYMANFNSEIATTTLNNVSITNNTAVSYGGGIAQESGTLTITGSRVQGNVVQIDTFGCGGGIMVSSGLLTLNQTDLSGNTSAKNGGGLCGRAGISPSDTVTIIESKLNANVAALDGGAIWWGNAGELVITASALTKNVSTAGFGGALMFESGSSSIVNSTISGNRALSGAALLAAFGDNKLINNTFAANTATLGSGSAVRVIGGTTKMRNMIIANNSATTDVSGANSNITSLGNNLIGQPGIIISFSTANNDVLGTAANSLDAKLRPLGNHGGATETMPPFADSPAINAGSNCVLNQSCATDNLSFNLTTDQRGKSRSGATTDFVVDIGAVESQAAVVINRNDSGTGSLRSFVDDPLPYDRIRFGDQFLTGSPTITVATPISINRALDITGISPARVAVSGNNAVRTFQIGSNGDVALKNISITAGNAGGGEGGNIRNAGTLRMENCAFSNGVTTANGGGIANVAGAKLFMDRCGFTGNQAGTTGGAIDNAGTMQVTNTTFVNNIANSGAAIHTSDFGTDIALLRHLTITGNSATASGGGIRYVQTAPTSQLSIQNSIVAANNAPTAPDVQGAFTSVANNLIGKSDGASGFTNGVNADIVGSVASPIAPNLQPCGNFGGIITSCPPLPSSRAINNGAPSSHPLDQRGLPRAIEGKADIGATDFNMTPAGLLQADGTRLLLAPSGAYAQTLKGFGGDFSFSGIGLPAFLSITPSPTITSEATLSGTIGPAQAGVYNFSIVGTNTQGFSVTNNYKFVAAQSLLNVDNSSPNTIYDAPTDGTLIVRYLLGYRGAALTAGALGVGSNLRNAAQIEAYLADLAELFDVDGDGKTLPMTDGLMILRRMLMPTLSTANAATITANAKNSSRSDADIVNAIDALKP